MAVEHLGLAREALHDCLHIHRTQWSWTTCAPPPILCLASPAVFFTADQAGAASRAPS